MVHKYAVTGVDYLIIIMLIFPAFLLQKSTSGFKLSATVPAFVPGIAYTTATSRSVLVRSSNLSPLVPEFHPSGSFTASVSSPSQHIRSKEASTQHGKVELQQVCE